MLARTEGTGIGADHAKRHHTGEGAAAGAGRGTRRLGRRRQCAVPLAKGFGAEATGVCNATKADLLQSIGASERTSCPGLPAWRRSPGRDDGELVAIRLACADTGPEGARPRARRGPGIGARHHRSKVAVGTVRAPEHRVARCESLDLELSVAPLDAYGTKVANVQAAHIRRG